MVCICTAVLILQNEIQQHNNSNNGGEYEWQRVKQVSGSHCNNGTTKQIITNSIGIIKEQLQK